MGNRSRVLGVNRDGDKEEIKMLKSFSLGRKFGLGFLVFQGGRVEI